MVADVIDKMDRWREFMFLGLRMNEGSQEKPLRRAFGISIDAIYKDTIDSLKKQELLVVKGTGISIYRREERM